MLRSKVNSSHRATRTGQRSGSLVKRCLEKGHAESSVHTVLSWFLFPSLLCFYTLKRFEQGSRHPGHPSGLMWSLTAGARGPDPADSGFSVAPQTLCRDREELCVPTFADHLQIRGQQQEPALVGSHPHSCAALRQSRGVPVRIDIYISSNEPIPCSLKKMEGSC